MDTMIDKKINTIIDKQKQKLEEIKIPRYINR